MPNSKLAVIFFALLTVSTIYLFLEFKDLFFQWAGFTDTTYVYLIGCIANLSIGSWLSDRAKKKGTIGEGYVRILGLAVIWIPLATVLFLFLGFLFLSANTKAGARWYAEEQKTKKNELKKKRVLDRKEAEEKRLQKKVAEENLTKFKEDLRANREKREVAQIEEEQALWSDLISVNGVGETIAVEIIRKYPNRKKIKSMFSRKGLLKIRGVNKRVLQDIQEKL